MRNTNFSVLFNEFENYGLDEEDKKEDAVEFDFGSELHREYLTCSNEFTYAHLKVGSGVMTVGGTRVDDKLYYAVALCSPKDNFSKVKGRAYVREYLQFTEYSKKRGVLHLASQSDELPPAIVLKAAAEAHLDKMRHKPSWTMGAEVKFRSLRREDRKKQARL